MKLDKLLAGTLALVLIAGLGTPALAGSPSLVPGDMIGSTSNDIGLIPSVNSGSITLVSQIDASQNFIGDPTVDGSLSGLDFDGAGMLWGVNNIPATPFNTPTSDLIKINPDTGALVDSIPILSDTGAPVGIQDLAVQPGTDILFGTTVINDNAFGHPALVTIDTTSGTASLVNLINTGDNADTNPIAFTPDGTLYMFSQGGNSLLVLNPNDASILDDIPISENNLKGLGSRSDGILFGSSIQQGILEIDPSDGSLVVIGPNQNPDSITDITFVPDETQPPVVGGEFLPIDNTALLLAGLQTSAIWMLPVLAGAAGVGAYYIKTRTNKDN